MMKENSIMVFNYCKEHDGENFCASDIADAVGLTARAVNGIVTAAFCRYKKDGEFIPLMERVPAEIKMADGTSKVVKLIRLTDEGRKFDPTAEVADE